MLLPALHVVSEHLGFVPPQAVIEVAQLLGLAPAEVQDTLSFYGFFKQDAPGADSRLGLPLDQLLGVWRRGIAGTIVSAAGYRPGGQRADGRVTVEYENALGPAISPPPSCPATYC